MKSYLVQITSAFISNDGKKLRRCQTCLTPDPFLPLSPSLSWASVMLTPHVPCLGNHCFHSSLLLPPKSYFGEQGLFKHPLTHPWVFFHYLFTCSVTRQPCSVTAFDFKSGLFTGMKNAHLAEAGMLTHVWRKWLKERRKKPTNALTAVSGRDFSGGKMWNNCVELDRK